MRAKVHEFLLLACVTCLGCAGLELGTEIEFTNPETGEVVETTVGDALADQVEETGEIVGGVAGKALGALTGNPVVGVSASALIAALIGSGASRLRRKKNGETAEEVA
jgi:outer membrane lipoprotein SlyB